MAGILGQLGALGFFALLGSSPLAAEVTTSFYDADGGLVQESNPDQATTISVYSADGEVACAEDGADMAVSLAADPTGTYPYSCTGFNPAEPPTTGSGPGYEETIYDRADLALSSTNANGDTTSYTYDPDGLVLTTHRAQRPGDDQLLFLGDLDLRSRGSRQRRWIYGLYSTTSPPAQGESSGITATYTYEPGGPRPPKQRQPVQPLMVMTQLGTTHRSITAPRPAAIALLPT